MTNIQIICKLQFNLLKPEEIMKKYIYSLFFIVALSSCYDDDSQNQNFIPNIVFNSTINLNLPESQDLLIPSGFVVYPGLGHRGVIVYNTGMGEQSIDEFLAFDLACPHIEVPSCANPMDISEFPELKNSCASDGIYYRSNIVSRPYSKDEKGVIIPVEGTEYYLQQYKIDRIGVDRLRISNF
jgi:hypothetical protein